MAHIVIATGNEHKKTEICGILRDFPIRFLDLSDFSDISEVEEEESGYERNAVLKACGYSLQTGLPAVADDSGLEIDFFGGAPGPLSARFIDPALPFGERCRIVLSRMEGVPAEKRRARFVCVAAVARGERILGVFRGVLEGMIAPAASGKEGFGYDPIFYIPQEDATLAEIPGSRKNRISHRALAFRAAAPLLATLAGAPDSPVESEERKQV